MLIQSSLFSKGHPLRREANLADVLEHHKKRNIEEIKSISDLDQLTDDYLQQLVKEAIVEPLAFRFDQMTRKLRTEEFDGEQFASYIPRNSMAGRMAYAGDFRALQSFDRGGSGKQVARISIPFTGCPLLLEYAPNPCGLNFPKGEICGNTIQFDVVLWAAPDDAERVKNEIQNNRTMTEENANKINQQVRSFNESLPATIKAAFQTKLDQLTKQHNIFDNLGIAEEPEPAYVPDGPATEPRTRGKARAGQIIQIIDKMFVQQLNQTNYNAGDVNNAIQSGE